MSRKLGRGMATRYSLQADASEAKAFINTYDEDGIAPTANFGR